MARIHTRAFRDVGIVAVCSALVVMLLPTTWANAAAGAFDQPAAGTPWTLGSVDPVSASLDDTSKAYMSATNSFGNSPVQVDITVADSATSNVSLRYYSPQNNLVGWHGSVTGDFEIPPVDGSAKIVAPRVDEGEKDKPFGAQDNPRDYGYGCIAPAGVIINGNVPAGSAWQCDDMGTLTITFSKPVVDPVVSFGGFGGGLQASGGRPEPYSYLVAPRLRLTAPAGATVSLLKGNGNLVASGTDIGVPHPGAWAACNSTYKAPTIGSTPGFPAKAGCGTVKITGSGKTFTFSLSKKVYMLEDDSFIAGAINKPTVRTATDQFSMQVGAYIPATQTITYDGNGATAGAVPSSSAPEGWDDTIAANGFTAPAGSSFLGWSTNPNATTPDATYTPGNIVAMPASGLTLYAVWGSPSPPPPPPPPVVSVQAVDDYYTTPMNTPMTSGDAAAKDSAQGATLAGATWTQTSNPAHGTVTGWDPATGKFTYTPDKDWYGTDSFRYTVCLAAPNDTVCSTATEYITVPPTIVAVDDYYSTALNTPMTGGDARAQDSSVVPGGITGSTVTQTSQPAHGTVTWNPTNDGTFTYTPDKDWSGTDSFTYRICLPSPNQDVCSTATEYITVHPPITAVDDYYSTPMDTPMTKGAAATGDSSPSGLSGATWTKTSNPAHGTVSGWDPATGTFTYTPAKGWSGTDSFTYRVCLPAPNSTVCDTATEYITVSPVTVKAVDDNYFTTINTPMTGGNAKAKDSSPSGLSGATFTQMSEPLHGTVTDWNPVTGRFTYIPNTDWVGTDSFTYRICLAAPNHLVCATATEYITVATAPTVSATDDTYSTSMNTPMTQGNAKAGDSSPVGLAGATFTQLTQPKHGKVSGWDPATGKFTYTPDRDWTGTDSFTYRVCLAPPHQNVCAEATEYITVSPPKPGAKPVTPPMSEDFGLDPASTTHTFDPVASFIPSKGAKVLPDTLSLARPGSTKWGNSVTIPGQGTFTVVNGKVKFVAEPSFVGTATVRYRVQDSSGQWADSTLSVKVAWSKPIAAPLTKDLGIWHMGQAYTFKATKGFTPSRGAKAVTSSMSIAPLGSRAWGKKVAVPGKGVFTVARDGRVTYTGPACYTGSVTIRYRAQDSTGQWADSTLTIKVRNPGGKELCRL